MKRLLTAAVAAPLCLLAVYFLPSPWFFLLTALILSVAAFELVTLARAWAPDAPLRLLPPLAVALAAVLALPQKPPTLVALVALVTTLSVGVAIFLLLGRTPVAQSLPALGALAFGVPYLALPIACLTLLQRRSPWLVFLLVGIVWAGDSAAYYVGRQWGRRRLAPVVSPNKTWEGAAASLLAAGIVIVVWSSLYWERLTPGVLVAGLLTAVAGQLGDLVESQLKRGAGVKDSGNLLPGHGGLLDRVDALLFAAPVLWLGLWLLAPEVLGPP